MKPIAILARATSVRAAQAIIAVLVLACAGAPAYAADPVEGVNYFRVDPPHPYAPVAGKVEVVEAFSYACNARAACVADAAVHLAGGFLRYRGHAHGGDEGDGGHAGAPIQKRHGERAREALRQT